LTTRHAGEFALAQRRQVSPEILLAHLVRPDTHDSVGMGPGDELCNVGLVGPDRVTAEIAAGQAADKGRQRLF
jgi:hypothetical protein